MAKITISGAIGSSFALLKAIPSKTEAKKFHNRTEIDFDTKQDATLALSEARQSLMSDPDDWKRSNTSYSRGKYLTYDSATARISNDKE